MRHAQQDALLYALRIRIVRDRLDDAALLLFFHLQPFGVGDAEADIPGKAHQQIIHQPEDAFGKDIQICYVRIYNIIAACILEHDHFGAAVLQRFQ